MAPRSDLLWSLPLLLLLPQRTASFASNGVFARSNAPSQAAAPVALRPAELMVRHPRAKMIFDQFDRDAMRLIMDAQAETRKLGGESVGTEHVLLASCMQSDELQASLERAGLKADELRVAINPNSRKMPGLDSLFAASSKDELLPFAKDTERAFKTSLATTNGDALVGSRDLVISLLADKNADAGARRVLREMDIDWNSVVKEVKKGPRELVGAGRGKGKGNSTLTQCSVDLTQKAAEGLLDPLIGRDPEVRRCVQILVRRRKNNPVLIGDPGVGKTAVAEGLAMRIHAGTVPPRLKDKRLLSLELGLLVADTKYRGEFEQRLKEVVEEVTRSDDIILFIDELHTIVGAGAADGAIDAANLLKPALSRGEMQCIGATTVTEYRKYIEKDAALERRFQPVRIDEPSEEETVQILRGLERKYSEYHEVIYSEEALEAAAKLSIRYIPDRFLPDKAIDLIDEAGAVVQMDAFESGRADEGTDPTVGFDDIAAVVSEWTGIPVSKLTTDEARKMINLEGNLHERVIGQDGAVSAIARALRRARVGLRSPTRPVASMIFSGPTGVGKTELAKAVAELYYGSEKAMVRLDMSEYMESFSVSRLTGPPPGYVGYEQGGQLTEAVRRNPHSVILLDEVEKAHPDVFNILLQVLDDGRLTDNKGRTVDFTNAMLILTSNVGSRKILQLGGAGSDYLAMRTAVKGELSKNFRPEFLNRLDEIIVFSALDRNEILEVADIMLQEMIVRCIDNEIALEIAPDLKDEIATSGYSPVYGARPLRRAVQRLCEDAIAEAILDGFVEAGGRLMMDADGQGGILLTNGRGDSRSYVPQASSGIEDDASAADATTPSLAESMSYTAPAV